MLVIPQPDYRLRLLTIGYGLVNLFWLSLEDTQVWPVAALGWIGALLGAVTWTLWNLGGQSLTFRQVGFGAVALGAVIGLGAALLTVALMFFKNALHAHLFLDFPVGLMLAMLQRIPAWMAAGVLVMCGVLMFLASRVDRS